MSQARKLEYIASASRLLAHLDAMLDPEHGYPEEPTWGYSFTYLAALLFKDGDDSFLARKALAHIARQDISSPEYSWEFVVFALQQSRRLALQRVELPFDGYREKGTRMFNWYLLRFANARMCNKSTWLKEIKFRLLLWLHQDSSGYIYDEFRTRSLQYHAFCLFVLIESLEFDWKLNWLKDRIKRGVEFSVSCMLQDGTALYMGRGQEQIFGYGALLYALEYCQARICSVDEAILNRLWSKVGSYQRTDGSFPLVLRHREPEPPRVAYDTDRPDGWYGYNSLYDYQPFLAYCLLKAGVCR